MSERTGRRLAKSDSCRNVCGLSDKIPDFDLAGDISAQPLKRCRDSRVSYFSRSECFLCLDSPSALTRIALKPLTGHSCSQIPHPVHRSGSTWGAWSRTCNAIFSKSEVLSSGGTRDSRMIESCELERIRVLAEIPPLSTRTKKSPVPNRSG